MATVMQYGGKASNLLRMQAAGFPVPPFFVVPRETVATMLAPLSADIERFCAALPRFDDAQLAQKAGEIQQKIKSLNLPASFPESIAADCRRLFGDQFRVAVRSSAAGEDGTKTSFAGQHATFLGVREADLVEKILAVVASAYSANALKYRILRQLSVRGIQIAVIVQQMVDAAKSGVGFSMNPGGNLADALIVAGYGMGEGVVGSRVETDTFVVHRPTGALESHITPKQTALVFSPGRGVVEMPVADEKRNSPVLTEEEVRQVWDRTLAAETLLGVPSDIEFSFDREGKLFILQMRPITTLDREKIKILDNTNIVESYPGLTLPLSFSFAAKAYERVFSSSSRAFLVPRSAIRGFSDVFQNLLAHCKGRVYYRLDNWYRMMSLVYGSRRSMQAWEKAVGLAQGESHSMHFSFWKKVRTVLASVWLILNYRQGNKRFFEEFYKNYAVLRDFRSHLSSPEQLWRHYENATGRLFRPWHLTLVNDFLAFKAFGWLQELTKQYGDDYSESLANDLLCGQGGVESEEAILSVLELKEAVKNDAELSALFRLPAGDILPLLAGPKYRMFYEKLHQHLEKYGDRTLEELKLEVKSPRSHPEIFIGLLKNQLLSTVTSLDFRRKQVEIRQNAENKIATYLRWWQARTWLFRAARSLAAYGLKNRENMRFCRTRAYSAVKDIFAEIGKMMAEKQVIAHPEDVFWLEIEDLRAFCPGEDRTSKIQKIAALKAAFETYRDLQLTDRIMYIGDELPGFGSRTWKKQPGAKYFQGIAVSKGIVTAPAAVITEPRLDADVRGKILVSKMTDPGWIFLMAQAAGLLSEKGSLLSHTAIVGRELGIPVVVGVTEATSIFKNGDMLRLDGNAGTVAWAAHVQES
ncbi:MAG: Prodigiosin synthesizing transferase PigC [Saprospiraceae bacterium]|nr:Prodigiosin synthesizing transferase PigC [Saprospiraceae bacterium]